MTTDKTLNKIFHQGIEKCYLGKRTGHLLVCGASGCLEETTHIRLTKRTKQIKWLPKRNSFKVISYNFDKKEYEEDEAILINSGEKEVFEIIFEDGSKISATEEHIFFNEEGKEVKLKGLKNNQIVLAGYKCGKDIVKCSIRLLKKRIKSITKVGVRKVYDLKVLKNNNFLANDVLVHNSGKTVFFSLLAGTYRNFSQYGKAKIIFITEKEHSPMENCFMGIEAEPNNKVQQSSLEKNGMKGRFPKREQIEIYHPFTFDFPTFDVPNVLYPFTFSIKDIDDVSWSALFGSNLDSPMINLIQDVRRNLNNEDNLWSFMLKTFKKSSVAAEKGKIKISSTVSELNPLPIETFGGKKEIEKMKVKLMEFQRHFFLQDDNCELNLSEDKWKKLIRDRQTITFFSTKYINDRPLKYFVYIELMKKLSTFLPKYQNCPVVLILEEIKQLLPFTQTSGKTFYEQVLSQNINNILVGIRSSNCSVCLEKNTYISTQKGNKKIKDITKNDKVFSYNFKKKKIQLKKVEKFESGKKEVYKVETEDKKIVFATKEHIFFTKKGNNISEIKVSHIKKGCLLLTK